MTQHDKALHFAALHRRPGNPLLLTNIWDAGSARAVERAGAQAIATSSWAMAAACGMDDGELLPFDRLVVLAGEIVRSVGLPVTVDFERGYAQSPAQAADNLKELIACGIVGINLEDGLPGTVACRDTAEQAQRIAALRDRAESLGLPLFLNAHCDLFFNAAPQDHAALVEPALDRARAYAAAGASGLFLPGLLDPALFARIAAATALPLNIMATDLAAPLAPLARCGVQRISRGPAPWLAAMAALDGIASN